MDDEDPPRTMPAFGILLLNWNNHEDVVNCVRSIRQGSYGAVHIYVIDNGSRPDSVDYIKRNLVGTQVIENGKNLGFTGGFNVGIRRALADGVDIICVMNSDLSVARDFLDRLADAFRDPEVAPASPKELDYFKTRRVLSAGGHITPMLSRREGFDQIDQEAPSVPHDTEMLCGPAMVFRASVLRQLGGFDERLFFCGEDHEMTLRLRRSGMRIRYVPEAKVWHKGGGSTGKSLNLLTAYFGLRNYILVAMKYGTRVQRFGAVCVLVLLRVPKVICRSITSRDPRYLTALIWLLFWFLNPARVPSDPEIVEALTHSSTHPAKAPAH